MEFTWDNPDCPVSDMVLFVGPEKKRFYCHAYVLCQHGDYFVALCRSPWNESATRRRVVLLPEIDPDQFTLLLHFMYGKKLGGNDDMFNKPNLATLFRMADRFGCQKLLQTCVDRVSKSNFSLALLEVPCAQQEQFKRLWDFTPLHLMLFKNPQEIRSALNSYSSDILIGIVMALINSVQGNEAIKGIFKTILEEVASGVFLHGETFRRLWNLFKTPHDPEISKLIDKLNELEWTSMEGNLRKKPKK